MTDTALIRDDKASTRLYAGVKDSMPAPRQFVLLFGIAAAVALGLWLFFWAQEPGYMPLYGNLSERDSAGIVEILQKESVPYRLDPATGAITVPGEQVHAVRLKLAAQGLPQGDPRAGIELIEGEQGFGVSQFVESARYQHALETELARTIATLRPVRQARVHLALSKPSAFARNRELATASVVLELFPGRTLEPNQVAAIVHMVSSSIPALAPENVTVVDQGGQLLTNPDPDGEDAQASRQFEQARRMESAYAERVRRLLEPVTGPGRVSVQVNVDMDFSVVEEAREVYGDPARVRSEQTSEEMRDTRRPAGVPGATSNTPPGTAANGAANAGETTSRTASRNYELDRTLTHTRQLPGRIQRVTTAVLVDHVPQTGADGVTTWRALSAEEITRLEKLVQDAVGFEAARGDSVSVVNTAFVRPTAPVITDEPAALWDTIESTPPAVRDGLRLLVGAVAVLALIFGVLRPSLRQLVPRSTADAGAAAGSPPALAGPLASGPDMPGLPAPSHTTDDVFQRARLAVNDDPKRVAQVVKNWINTHD
ncbi:MAG: flagellar basal-body MS-ring/collar protein FliF [Pseudomonadota bacterium]